MEEFYDREFFILRRNPWNSDVIRSQNFLPIPCTMQAKVCSVYAEQEKCVLMLSVIMVYSPRHTSWHISGTFSWTQQGTWFLPSAKKKKDNKVIRISGYVMIKNLKIVVARPSEVKFIFMQPLSNRIRKNKICNCWYCNPSVQNVMQFVFELVPSF